MMNRLLSNIQFGLFAVAITFLLAGCTDDMFIEDDPRSYLSYDENGNLKIPVTLEAGDMTTVSTRGLSETPDFENMGIYMLVFDEAEGLKQFSSITPVEVIKDEKHPNEGLVKFNIILEPTENTSYVHFIATSDLGFGGRISYGMEEQVVPTLFTEDGTDALWQKIDFGTNIPGREKSDRDLGDKDFLPSEEAKAQNIVKKLTHIPMVRNFSKISVKFGDDFTQQGYRLTDLYVVNTVNRGTVAPYRATFDEQGKEDDVFVPFYTEQDDEYIPLTYRDITDYYSYQGRMPAGVKIINTIDKPDEIMTHTEAQGNNPPAPVYFYERPARPNSAQRTYAIVGIEFTKAGATSPSKNFYKIDIGHVYDQNGWDIGLFEYYNLLRNFNFEITIHSVTGDGYSSVAEAGNGVVFNNISSTVEAKSMKSISDGEDWIYVDKMNYIFTRKGETVEIWVQYKENISSGGTLKNEEIKFKVPDNSIYEKVGERYEGNYKVYTLQCKADPGKDLPSAEFYVYRGNKAGNGEVPNYGLYRVITLYMHEPYQFKHIDTFPGLWEDMDENPWDWGTNVRREIGQHTGSPLTLFFELPPDLPQGVFPIDFIIESDRQNIQNAYQGNAVVRSVPAEESLFSDRPQGERPKSSRIQYVKTVTWYDYSGSWDDDFTDKGTNLVRCRFLTTTDLMQDGVGSGSKEETTSVTTLRVQSDPLFFGRIIQPEPIYYFEDTFERIAATSDPSPRFWDFSSGIWDALMANMNLKSRQNNNQTVGIDYRTQYTENSPSATVDALYFIEGAGGTGGNPHSMSNVTIYDPTYERYIICSNINDVMRHEHSYDQSTSRQIRVKVVSTDYNGNPVPPLVQLTGVKAGNNNQTAITLDHLVDEDETLDNGRKVFVFQTTINANITDVNVDIKPSQANMRFYKIDFFPRWDEIGGN